MREANIVECLGLAQGEDYPAFCTKFWNLTQQERMAVCQRELTPGETILTHWIKHAKTHRLEETLSLMPADDRDEVLTTPIGPNQECLVMIAANQSDPNVIRSVLGLVPEGARVDALCEEDVLGFTPLWHLCDLYDEQGDKDFTALRAVLGVMTYAEKAEFLNEQILWDNYPLFEEILACIPEEERVTTLHAVDRFNTPYSMRVLDLILHKDADFLLEVLETLPDDQRSRAITTPGADGWTLLTKAVYKNPPLEIEQFQALLGYIPEQERAMALTQIAEGFHHYDLMYMLDSPHGPDYFQACMESIPITDRASALVALSRDGQQSAWSIANGYGGEYAELANEMLGESLAYLKHARSEQPIMGTSIN